MSFEARRYMYEDRAGTITDKRAVRRLIHKWQRLLEGVPDRTRHQRYILGTTAMLMENQSRYLCAMTEETRAINVGAFTKFIFPVLRRVFPNLIANEVVSVQPMTAPIGAVFFLDYVYGTTKGGTTAGNLFPKDFDRDYTSEYVNGEPLATGNGADYAGAGAFLSVTLAYKPVRPLDTARGFSVVIREIVAADGSIRQEATDDGSGGFTGDAASGTINYSNGAISGFKFNTVPLTGNQIKCYYYYDGEANTALPQMNLDVKKAPIEAVPRRLKALWSSEGAEDLRAFHGIDAETEIVSAAAQEIALEIDREIIQDLFAASTTTTATFDRIPPGGISELDHLRALVTVISSVSGQIHKKTLRAPANWLITSPEISALITQLTTHGDYKPLWTTGSMSPDTAIDMPRPLTQHGMFGIYKTGTLMNKWILYEDPFFTTDRILVGLKGSSYLDAGYVWAPYIPLQVTPTFLDPSDMAFRKGLRTRYGRKLLRPEFYGQIRVLNL